MMLTMRTLSVIFNVVFPTDQYLRMRLHNWGEGVLKEQVFHHQFRDVVDLIRIIEDECNAFREQPEFLHKSCLTVWNRCKRCTDGNGFQFERKM